MKILIAILILLGNLATAQCTYGPTSADTLAIVSGESFCVDYDTVVNKHITIYDGGSLSIRNSSTFRVVGAISVYGTGKIMVEDCNSKLEVVGSYNGGYNTCEIDYYCTGCTSSPFELISGAKIWDEYCCVAPLPVELIAFDVVVKPSWNEISWTTLTEINASHYTLERSEDAINWEHVRTVPARNTPTIQGYALAEHSDATCYYRLTQYDLDGSFTQYDIIIADREPAKIIMTISLSGVVVDSSYRGMVIDVYNNGMAEKKVQN